MRVLLDSRHTNSTNSNLKLFFELYIYIIYHFVYFFILKSEYTTCMVHKWPVIILDFLCVRLFMALLCSTGLAFDVPLGKDKVFVFSGSGTHIWLSSRSLVDHWILKSYAILVWKHLVPGSFLFLIIWGLAASFFLSNLLTVWVALQWLWFTLIF